MLNPGMVCQWLHQTVRKEQKKILLVMFRICFCFFSQVSSFSCVPLAHRKKTWRDSLRVHPLHRLTSAELVSRAVAVEVVTLAELPAVPLLRVLPRLALAGAAHALPVVAADVGAVVLAAGPVHVLRGHFVAAALALPAHATVFAPEAEVLRVAKRTGLL